MAVPGAAPIAERTWFNLFLWAMENRFHQSLNGLDLVYVSLALLPFWPYVRWGAE